MNTVSLIERVVHDEAGGEGKRGRDAVRAVIYNRLASGKFGDTPLAVLNAKNQFEGVWKKAGGDARNLPIPADKAETYMKEHVEFLESGKDPTNGATFFLNKAIAKNPFNKNFTGLKIGNHEFFNHYNGKKVDVPEYEVSLRGVGQGQPKKEQQPEPSFLERAKKFIGDYVPFGDSTGSKKISDAGTSVTATDINSQTLPQSMKYEGEVLPLQRGGFVKLADGGTATKKDEGFGWKGAASLAADFTPIVGELKSAYEGYEAYKKGDYLDAALGAAGAIPLVGGAVRGAKKGAKAVEAGESVFKALTKKTDDVATASKETAKAAEEAGKALTKAEPQKTVTAYKLFRTNPDKPGELFPLFVNADKGVPVGKWIPAEVGPITEKGQVKSKIGDLAYRPGWHAGDNAAATHIGGKSTPDLKKPDYRPADQVWAEVQLPADVDWQTVANSRASIVKSGPNKGQINAKEAHITDQLPEGGHYRYKTNPNMQGEWLIGGEMKVNRTLDADELAKVHKETGVPDLPTLPEVIDKKGLKLDDLNKEAVKELKTFYPEKFDELSSGLGLNTGGLLGRKYSAEEDDTPIDDTWVYVTENPANYGGKNYERGDMKVKMNCGGIMAPDMMGMDLEVGEDPVSGNPVPPGSLPNEVRDDIPAMLSEGEFVLPADVVRWHGLKHIMDMRSEAKMGLMAMQAEGMLHELDPADAEEDAAEGETEEEDDTETETPEGNKVTKAAPKIEESGMEVLEGDEAEEYAKKLNLPVGDERILVILQTDPSVFRT